ncbi:MAG: hypothetical protein ACI84D_003717 [Thalassolituus oleivorans]|jgi:hypothetical protein
MMTDLEWGGGHRPHPEFRLLLQIQSARKPSNHRLSRDLLRDSNRTASPGAEPAPIVETRHLPSGGIAMACGRRRVTLSAE